MTATDELAFEDWRNKPVVTRHLQFTGFDDDGNGWALLNWLHDRGVQAYGRDEVIFFETPEREEAVARVGWWFIEGTQGEVYAIKPVVHDDKYERVIR